MTVKRLSTFVREVVATRRTGENYSDHRNVSSKVVMKMDIEGVWYISPQVDLKSFLLCHMLYNYDVPGSELEVLSDLLMTGAMPVVDHLMVEFHYHFDEGRNVWLRQLRQGLAALSVGSGTLVSPCRHPVWSA